VGDAEARRGAAWRFVRAVVGSQAQGVTGAVASGLLWQAGAVAAPLVVKYAIDHGIVGQDHRTLVIWLLVLLAVGMLEVVAGAFRHLYAIRNRSHSDARVRDAIFAHALRLDASYHDRVGPGELLSRASSDSQHVARMMDAIGHTIGYVLTVVAVAIVMLFLDWQLALIVLIPVPFVTLGAWLYSRRYDAGTRELQDSWAQASTLVEETVSGIRVVKGLGAGDALESRFRRRSNEIMERALHLARLDAIFIPLLEMLPLLGIAAVLWFGGRSVISGSLSVGSFVAFNAYVVMLVWPLRVLGQRVTTLQKALGASGRITEVLEAEPQLREPRHPEELERPVRGDVRLEGVRFGHEGDHAVLEGLDLHVAPGESMALVGRAGAPPARGRAPSPASSRASTTPRTAASCSTATTCAPCGSPRCGASSRSSSRRRFSSARACARTSASAAPTQATRTWNAPPGWRARRTSSQTCPTATRRCSASAASRFRAASGSGSRSPARFSPTRPCSSSTTPPPRSTRRRSTRSAPPSAR
jgi:ATP-binding cassette subfamily B protein